MVQLGDRLGHIMTYLQEDILGQTGGNIMVILRKFVLVVAASALVMTSAAPAMARDYDDYDYGRHHGDHDKIDGGDVLTGIGILAGIAILATVVSSSSSKKHRSDTRYPDQYPRSYGGRPGDSRSYQGNSDDVGTAVNACSAAAEQRAGGNVGVDEIRSVTREGAAWLVEGILGNRGDTTFRCSTTYGQVDYVRLG
jgi:hypothetical protein